MVRDLKQIRKMSKIGMRKGAYTGTNKEDWRGIQKQKW